MFAELASLLFYSRDYAHRAHLVAGSHSRHVVLEEFYKELTELIDTLVEVYQGRNGSVAIPVLAAEDDLFKPGPTLRSHLDIIERVGFDDRAVAAVIDDICATYLRTLYKLAMAG